jgi:aspartyl-tRNA(Asn)/glutamyl-tRNA(Gln) amidotransferase subunit A
MAKLPRPEIGLVRKPLRHARPTPQALSGTDAPRTVMHARQLLRNGDVTCLELAQHALSMGSAIQSKLKCLITLTPEYALEVARRRDAELRSGLLRGPLHDTSIAHKDIFHTGGIRITRGSRAFHSRVPSSDADIVSHVTRSGVVMVGKGSMNECAVGLSDRNRAYGDVRNALDCRWLAGGSSSGTAAAASAGVCLVGTGTDTGGSIRAPAADNGIVPQGGAFADAAPIFTTSGTWPELEDTC